MNTAQHRILNLLRDRSVTLPPSTIGLLLFNDRSTSRVCKTLKILIGKGHVSKTKNRKGAFYRLTAKGKRALIKFDREIEDSYYGSFNRTSKN